MHRPYGYVLAVYNTVYAGFVDSALFLVQQGALVTRVYRFVAFLAQQGPCFLTFDPYLSHALRYHILEKHESEGKIAQALDDNNDMIIGLGQGLSHVAKL